MGDKVSEIRTGVDLVDCCSDLKTKLCLGKEEILFITVG